MRSPIDNCEESFLNKKTSKTILINQNMSTNGKNNNLKVSDKFENEKVDRLKNEKNIINGTQGLTKPNDSSRRPILNSKPAVKKLVENYKDPPPRSINSRLGNYTWNGEPNSTITKEKVHKLTSKFNNTCIDSRPSTLVKTNLETSKYIRPSLAAKPKPSTREILKTEYNESDILGHCESHKPYESNRSSSKSKQKLSTKQGPENKNNELGRAECLESGKLSQYPRPSSIIVPSSMLNEVLESKCKSETLDLEYGRSHTEKSNEDLSVDTLNVDFENQDTSNVEEYSNESCEKISEDQDKRENGDVEDGGVTENDISSIDNLDKFTASSDQLSAINQSEDPNLPEIRSDGADSVDDTQVNLEPIVRKTSVQDINLTDLTTTLEENLKEEEDEEVSEITESMAAVASELSPTDEQTLSESGLSSQEVSEEKGYSESLDEEIEEEEGAEITEGPQNVIVTKGQSAMLSLSFTGIPPPEVTWLKKVRVIFFLLFHDLWSLIFLSS